LTPKVLTLVVTYEGEETIRDLLQSFLSCSEEKVCPLLIVDNASKDRTLSLVESFSLHDLEILRLPKNLGVGAVYNIGVQKARQLGVEWLFVLDQDSICGPRCLDALLQTAIDLVKNGQMVGAVCPTVKSQVFSDIIHYPYSWNGYRLESVPGTEGDLGDSPIPIDSTISSGTLYRVDALHAIEGFREEYFLDFVDHECHIRLRLAGWSLWWEKQAELYHKLGKIQKMTDEGIWIEHEPFRYYYMARNMLEGHWRLGGLKALINFGCEIYKHSQRLRRYGNAPGESIRYIFKGIKDAFLGKFGPLNTDH